MNFRHRLTVALVLASWLVIGGSCFAAKAPDGRLERVRPSATRNMVIYVRDQHGQLTANAEIVVRERFSYRLVGELVTNQEGYAQIMLDAATWYVAEVYFLECGSNEFWTYKYIGPDDWGSIYPYGEKTLRRNDPWIEQVTLPQGGIVPGTSAQVLATIDHDLVQTNFDLFCRMTLIIDDDGQPPYLYESLSDEQVIIDGFEPFFFEPALDQLGQHLVRLILERRFEGNAWQVADESGWAWRMTVGESRLPLEGLIYLDWDGNGQQGGDEPLGSGVVVRLYDAQDDQIAEATSNADGRFSFGSLAFADYCLRVTELPPGLGHPKPAYPVSLSDTTAGQIVMLALDPWLVQMPLVLMH